MRNQYFRKADLKIFEILIPEIPDSPVPMIVPPEIIFNNFLLFFSLLF